MAQKIKVLIVDDSALVRQTLADIFSADSELEVVGTASDPFVAAKRMESVVPDVITLDVEMPRMDGLTFLKKIMTQHPIPVVICSAVTEKGAEATFKAMEYGAVEIITKPRISTKQFLEESAIRICDAVKAAARARMKKVTEKLTVAPKLSADAVLPPPTPVTRAVSATSKVVVVGASTGGTEALASLLLGLPANCPPVAIVQHMPEHFTNAFARRLDAMCAMHVKEAEDNDRMEPGKVLIAPGNMHMLLKRNGSHYFVELKEGPLVRRHRPSVDVLFRSAARYGGKNVVGAILTGMGDDGAVGMKEMFDAGAYTIAQDEASCVVFGMPQEAIKQGGVHKVMSLNGIAGEILRMCNGH
ncbi:chemotaxis response regulator protein-glutamate methylesterase [Desulfovibrio subterraneus]|jgi:two-component system chemotaxis response regulator CheB|uniref:protein-glutamate methylesterase/protein-glutamine glutaminase n=1 Tax=Desulfovibrio subterraneus TaxID=2718620 RepID=UPI0022B923A3|nr:chemotaxis response regulator protein-glutamate methylesterase [Desulfovibrio subterraneus]WBF68193.1 chemotaxis response regulator protein-glutamate methylesterase [Desulfovibrio subterraneus]